MKIIRLAAENVKRLTAVEITPHGSVVTIGGKNGAGKSSVLDSIAYALGGQALVPAEPIRKGQAEAKITVDLGEFIVTRRFYREKEALSEGFSPDGNAWKWGPTKSTLIVTNKEGAKYPSPQAILDKLLGQLTFDPLRFARAAPKEQDEVLRRLVGLDFTMLNLQRKGAYDQRTMHRKTYEIKSAQLLALPTFKDAPAVEIPLTEISQEMMRAEHARRDADEAGRAVSKAEFQLQQASDTCQRQQRLIDDLTRQLQEAQRELVPMLEAQDGHALRLKAVQQVLVERLEAIPDVNALRQKLSEVEETNAHVRANHFASVAAEEVESIGAKLKTLEDEIEGVDTEKARLLSEAKFPVEGLGISDNGVTFNEIPFEQASTSEQLRVSVAIGLALNPTLKVLLIRNGNALDDESMHLVAEMAEKADAQVWLEYVASSPEGMAVMLEDGSVATTPATVST